MNKHFREFMRIPETVRVPWLGAKLYSQNCKTDLRRVQNTPVGAFSFNCEPRKEKVILSMTSFPDRINEVQYALRALMLQTYKPDRILLWLAESQFPDHVLPDSLLELESFGLEICYCEDLLGHKRYFNYYPQLKEDEVLITYDDDILFSDHSVERIIRKHEQFPHCIVCDRGQAAVYKADGSMEIPGRWQTLSQEGVGSPSFKVLPSPGGGCLYFKDALYKDVLDAEKVRHSLRIDDLFLMFMALQQGTPIVKAEKYHRTFTVINHHQEVQLGRDAIVKGYHMNALNEYRLVYPEAYARLTEGQEGDG